MFPLSYSASNSLVFPDVAFSALADKNKQAFGCGTALKTKMNKQGRKLCKSIKLNITNFILEYNKWY